MVEYTGPASCGLWCFGLSCGCSSERCLADEFDLAEAPDQTSTHHDCKESTSSGVYIGERISVNVHDVCGIVPSQSLSADQGSTNADADPAETKESEI